jgi:hypothetical protein
MGRGGFLARGGGPPPASSRVRQRSTIGLLTSSGGTDPAAKDQARASTTSTRRAQLSSPTSGSCPSRGSAVEHGAGARGGGGLRASGGRSSPASLSFPVVALLRPPSSPSPLLRRGGTARRCGPAVGMPVPSSGAPGGWDIGPAPTWRLPFVPYHPRNGVRRAELDGSVPDSVPRCSDFAAKSDLEVALRFLSCRQSNQSGGSTAEGRKRRPWASVTLEAFTEVLTERQSWL